MCFVLKIKICHFIFSIFLSLFLYTFLGTSKDITLGPTAIMALLVSQYCNNIYGDTTSSSDPKLTILLTFLTSIILLLMAIFKVGFLVNFIPHCVIVGFCCAASILISSSQIKNLVGFDTSIIKVPKAFLPQWKVIIQNFRQSFSRNDLMLGIISIIILKILQHAKQKYCEEDERDSKFQQFYKKGLWFVATARNAIVVILATLLAYWTSSKNSKNTNSINQFSEPFKLTGPVKEGLPDFILPEFTRTVPLPNPNHCFPECNSEFKNDNPDIFLFENGTLPSYDNPKILPFNVLLKQLGTGLIIIPMMAYLESIAIAKGFSKKAGYKVDATQELYAISGCCLATSLVQGFPVTGSFSRSAVNAASNVATPAGGIVTGLMVILSSLFLTPVFSYVPKAALAAVIFLAAISMFDWTGVKHVWTLRKLDILPLIITFILCFHDVAVGIGAGVAVALLIMLYSHARPQVKIDKLENFSSGKNANNGFTSGLIVQIDRNLDYPACDYVETKIMAHRYSTQDFLIIDLSRFTGLDSATAEQMLSLTSLKNIRTQQLLKVYFCSVAENIKKKLIRAGVEIEIIFTTDWRSVLIANGFCYQQPDQENDSSEAQKTDINQNLTQYQNDENYISITDLSALQLSKFDASKNNQPLKFTESLAYTDLVDNFICEVDRRPSSVSFLKGSENMLKSKISDQNVSEKTKLRRDDVALYLGY